MIPASVQSIVVDTNVCLDLFVFHDPRWDALLKALERAEVQYNAERAQPTDLSKPDEFATCRSGTCSSSSPSNGCMRSCGRAASSAATEGSGDGFRSASTGRIVLGWSGMEAE